MTQPQQPQPQQQPPKPATAATHIPLVDRLADLIARVDELSSLHNKLADAVTRELGL